MKERYSIVSAICIGAAIVALVLSLLLTGCAFHTLPPPAGALEAGGLARVYEVEKGRVYRSPQPSEQQFRVLVAKYGIRTVVKLNSALEGHDEVPDGVELIEDPVRVLADIPLGQIRQILDDIDISLERGPVLIHCSHGEDRTGLIVALWRLRHQKLLKPEFAFNEMVAFGFHDGRVNQPGLPELVDAFTKITGYKP